MLKQTVQLATRFKDDYVATKKEIVARTYQTTVRNSIATMFYLVVIKDEKLKAKFCHNNWKLGRDIKESIRLRKSVATQNYMSQHKAAQQKETQSQQRILLSRHTIQIFKLQGI